jgi:hypothetical protein
MTFIPFLDHPSTKDSLLFCGYFHKIFSCHYYNYHFLSAKSQYKNINAVLVKIVPEKYSQ